MFMSVTIRQLLLPNVMIWKRRADKEAFSEIIKN